MYVVTIESTFEAYKHNSVYLAEDIDSAKKYAIATLKEICDNTTNERQKSFASFLINRVKTEKDVSSGYSADGESIAVDIMGKEDYDKMVSQTKDYLEKEIEVRKEKLNKLNEEYKALL